MKKLNFSAHSHGIYMFLAVTACIAVLFSSCSSFTYKTYEDSTREVIEDPDPQYEITLNKEFQDYTNFMFIGNRIENFGTFFNTYYNAKENYDDAYNDYITKVLAEYSNRLDSINAAWPLGQQSIDLFTKAIEKSSRVIQYHKSSAFMDKAVLLVAKSYYYLGDYVKAQRKFQEFISKLSISPLMDENMLYFAKTQMRLGSYNEAMEKLADLIKNTKSNTVRADAYQTVAEYYLSRKDYEAAIANYKKAIEYSKDSEFKAQMQFILATVVGLKDPKTAAKEFDKVTDFSPSFDLEFYAKLNKTKNLILSSQYSEAQDLIENMRVKYKDNADFTAQAEFLQGLYWEQKNDFKKAFKDYLLVIQTYPKTPSSANASYQIAKHFELQQKNYLDAYRYYRYSTEENASTKYYQECLNKVRLFRRYYELRSVMAGQTINTDYDSLFYRNTMGKTKENENPNNLTKTPENPTDNPKGKNGGYSSAYTLFTTFSDSLLTNSSVDSSAIKREQIAKAKFELAELFDYDFKLIDSSEYYYLSSFDETGDYDFKSKILYALSGLYKEQGDESKSYDMLNRIVKEFPLSPFNNPAKRELNIPVAEEFGDSGDSLFSSANDRFEAADYINAVSGFRELLNFYPSSIHANKVKYSLGWIYENIRLKPDSAYMYYSQVIASNPKSEFAAAVQGKVKLYEDEMKKTQVIDTVKKDSINMTPPVKDSVIVKDSLKTFEPLRDLKDSEKKSDENKIDEKKPEELKPDTKTDGEQKPVNEDDKTKGDDKTIINVPPKKDN